MGFGSLRFGRLEALKSSSSYSDVVFTAPGAMLLISMLYSASSSANVSVSRTTALMR